MIYKTYTLIPIINLTLWGVGVWPKMLTTFTNFGCNPLEKGKIVKYHNVWNLAIYIFWICWYTEKEKDNKFGIFKLYVSLLFYKRKLTPSGLSDPGPHSDLLMKWWNQLTHYQISYLFFFHQKVVRNWFLYFQIKMSICSNFNSWLGGRHC